MLYVVGTVYFLGEFFIAPALLRKLKNQELRTTK